MAEVVAAGDRGRRPRIAVPGRFSDSASALRYAAVVNARALLESLWAAGADPVTLLPTAEPDPREGAARLDGFDGLLLPGGADVDPALYGAVRSPGTDAPDPVQDAFDLALLAHALDRGLPVLTVCRGTQVLNVLLGGTLDQHMGSSHVTSLHEVAPLDAELLGPAPLTVSCYHHQRIDRLAGGLEVIARAGDGTVEAVTLPDAAGWVLGVQWHPEDNAGSEPGQQHLLAAFVAAAAAFGSRRAGALGSGSRISGNL